jgi:hypothetical protein
MIAIHFDKEKAQQYLRSIKTGTAVEKPSPDMQGSAPAGWTGNDLLALAGACFTVAMSQGPHFYAPKALESLPKERSEAIEETFMADLRAAVQYYGQLTMQVLDGDYDQEFEPTLTAALRVEDGEINVSPGKGFKNYPT